MTWTLGDVVDRSLYEGLDEPQAIQIVNQAYSALIRRSGFLTSVVELGTQPPGLGLMQLPANVTKVHFVWAVPTDGSFFSEAKRYVSRVSLDDFVAVQNGDKDLAGGAIFTEMGAGSYGELVTLMIAPAPDYEFHALVSAELAPQPLDSRDDVLLIPDDFIQGLLDGVKAIVFKDIDEDVQSASVMEQSFQQAIADLTDYKRARTTGDLPIAMPMRGVHW